MHKIRRPVYWITDKRWGRRQLLTRCVGLFANELVTWICCLQARRYEGFDGAVGLGDEICCCEGCE